MTGCRQTQERMTALLAGAAVGRERLDIESHAAGCARCASTYRDLIAASVALERAYAPLRMTSAAISPARVHLALRLPQPLPVSVRAARVVARVNELALAAAVTAFAFVGTGSLAPSSTIVDEAAPQESTTFARSVPGDDQYFLRWIRLGRYAPPSDLLDPAVSPRGFSDDAQLITIERAGLVR